VSTPAEAARELTVLMGVFNGLPHLGKSIESILAQTFGDFEFLIIDDASTDASAEVIAQYAQGDRRIRFIRNAHNVGLGGVLSHGVLQARGRLIARMDADDVAIPERLQLQMNFLRDNPDVDLVGSYALDVSKDGVPVRERRVPVTHEKIAELVWTSPFIHPTVMFRRASILRVGSYLPHIRRRQDYDLWFRCVAGGLRLANIPRPLIHYLYSEETLRRNHVRSIWEQVKIGLRGCRTVRAPFHAYVATCMPLIEAAMPNWLRLRVAALKAKFDPRRV
jgi:glycosyltransferase involved in cell wall biosynthesis